MSMSDKWLATVITVLVLGAAALGIAGATYHNTNARNRQAACAARGGTWATPTSLEPGCYRITVTYTPVDSVASWR